MNPIVTHIISGYSLFTGSALITAGLLLPLRRSTGRRLARACGIAVLLGLLLAVLSSVPITTALVVLLSGGTLAACSERARKRLPRLVPVVCFCWLLLCIVEAPGLFTPRLAEDVARKSRPVVVIADSMTAGLGEGEATTWPKLLQQRYSGTVLDISHVGETSGSAVKRATAAGLPPNSIVIIEVGGNDILGGTECDRFAADLDQLLEFASREERDVFMFELPLPPFCHEWGRVQRQLCSKHNVRLIPKHVLASVVGEKSSTLDSIHLSQEGHDRMLKIVCHILRCDNASESSASRR